MTKFDPHVIHKKERIGRRVFGKAKDVWREQNGEKHYKMDVFMDNREGGLSVDRLGVNLAEKRRIRVLNPLGVAMGEKRGRVFRGWAQFNVTEIHELVVPTPAVGEENPYHAEIERDDHFLTPAAKRVLAMRLCDLARQYEFIVSQSLEDDS